MPLSNAQKQKDTRARRKAKLERLEVLEAALIDIATIKRSAYEAARIARQALNPTTAPHAGERDE